MRLTHDRFKADAQGLMKVLKGALDEAVAARAAKTEAERRAAEDALQRKQEEEVARAAEAELQAAERAVRQTAQGLTPEERRIEEELASWRFVERQIALESIGPPAHISELRNHLARFPGGTTDRFALEGIFWDELRDSNDLASLEAFVAEFPTERHAAEVASRIGFLKGKADAERAVVEAKQRISATENDQNDTISNSLAIVAIGFFSLVMALLVCMIADISDPYLAAASWASIFAILFYLHQKGRRILAQSRLKEPSEIRPLLDAEGADIAHTAGEPLQRLQRVHGRE